MRVWRCFEPAHGVWCSGVVDPGLSVEAVHTLTGLGGDGCPDLLDLSLLPVHFRLLLPAPKDVLYTCVHITFVPRPQCVHLSQKKNFCISGNDETASNK